MTGKIQILGKIAKVPAKIPTAGFEAASNSMQMLIQTHHEYKKIAAQEKTKREAIEAWKDVRLTELSHQKEILKTYLEETFKERREMIDGLFDALDKGMDSGNMDVINAAIGGIINLSKDSPLQNVDKLIHAMKDNDTKVISF